MRLAFVIHRFGEDVFGGIEFLCKELAQHLSKYFDIEIITTCAKDYLIWENQFPKGEEKQNSYLIKRFEVDFKRNIKLFNLFSKIVFFFPHPLSWEIKWMKMQGPYSSSLFNYLLKNKFKYDGFIFFSYLYATSLFGLQIVKEKSILIPAAHDEKPIYLGIFRNLFQIPKAIIFNTSKEREFLLKRFPFLSSKISTVGCFGIDVQKLNKKNSIVKDKFFLYIGRIDEAKGCYELFKYFTKYKKKRKTSCKLILIGEKKMPIPKREDIIYLGCISEKEKFSIMQDALALIIPSKFESLSIALLEAWGVGIPAVVNGKSDVLREHIKKAHAGVCYHNYFEFEFALDLFLRNPYLKQKMGEKGKEYVNKNFSWENIEKKLKNFIENVFSK